MNGLWNDVRHAVRAISRQKGLSVAALLSLALGIGANTALFSVVHGVLMRPLPYPGGDRLVRLAEEHEGATAAFRGSLLTDHTYRAWNQDSSTLEGIAAFSRGAVIDRSGSHPVRIAGAAVSPALFPMLRARPAAGRFFSDEDAEFVKREREGRAVVNRLVPAIREPLEQSTGVGEILAEDE